MDHSKQIIQNHLITLEQTQGIQILYACESGSRAWGFPSIDSDYDVRFIYKHPEDWYLSIQECRDVVELPINKELDINGWDLRKSLRLLIRHNATLFEWMQSPIVYARHETFLKNFTEVARSSFSPMASMHHYLSTAKKYYVECTSSDKVKLKKYFYCLRCTLAGEWIAHFKTVPPMELNKLLPLIQDNDHLLQKIHELVLLKAGKDESYKHPHEPELEAFLKESIAHCESICSSLPSPKSDQNILNVCFRHTIRSL